MSARITRREIKTLVSILSKSISTASKEFSNRISNSGFFSISQITNEWRFDRHFYIVCVYLCCSFLEQTVSPNIAAEILKMSLHAYNHTDDFMSYQSQDQTRSALALISDLERAVVRTPIMSDLEYYNELCLFVIKASRTEEVSHYRIVDIYHVADSNMGDKLKSWTDKSIHDVAIIYDSSLEVMRRSRRNNVFQGGLAFFLLLMFFGIAIPIANGIISASHEQTLDDYSSAYVTGYNTGAIEGARCGIKWSYEALDRTVPSVDCARVLSETSVNPFPLTEYYD